MNKISSQLKEIKDKKDIKEISDKKSYEQYQEWTDEFNRLVELGIIRQRGFQLRSISDTPLQTPHFNKGITR
ncbi:MAG: hypothetical protein LBE18_05470 [Planctomycetaceae bacterium]|jgi:hypothetical protein|nr:hypothetical protein [Planctomycetaceae bacterium]